MDQQQKLRDQVERASILAAMHERIAYPFVRMLAEGNGKTIEETENLLFHVSHGGGFGAPFLPEWGITSAQLAAHGARVKGSDGSILVDTPDNLDRALVALCRVIWGRFGG